MLIELSQKEIKMTIMAFTDKDMFIKDDKRFIIRKSSIPFFENNVVTIIDSDGKVFQIDSIHLNGNMLWWHFLKDGFYDYYNASIKTRKITNITISEFKEKITFFIEQNPKYGWNRITSNNNITKMINDANSFQELISVFHYFKA